MGVLLTPSRQFTSRRAATLTGSGLALRTVLVIPTYNAEVHWRTLEHSVHMAGFTVDDVLIIDSSSSDRTRELARSCGFRVEVIAKCDFDHGGTRRLACDIARDADALLFMTQDAVIADAQSVQRLCEAFDDPEVGAAYGRQLGREQGNGIERHSRLFGYPAGSRIQTFDDRERLGFRAAFMSNSFALYRRNALEEAGGFPFHVISGEDSYVGARMLMAGWKIAYVAEAVVVHSHGFTVAQEFRRYFDIGVHHAREQWIMETFGAVGGEGARYVQSELKFLLHDSPHLIPLAVLRTVSKLAAYQLGRRWRRLPRKLVRQLSSCRVFWDQTSPLDR